MIEFITILLLTWLLIGNLMGLINLIGFRMIVSTYLIDDSDKYLDQFSEIVKDTLRGPLVVAFPLWEERYYKNKINGRLK